MSVYSSRALGSHGVFGAFGGSNPEVFSGGPSFVGPDDSAIFLGTNTGFIQGAAGIGYRWVPPTDSFLTQVSSQWFNIGQSQNPADLAWQATTLAHLNTLLTSFSSQVGNHSGYGYSQDAQKQVVSYANQIKTVLTSILAYQIQPQPAPVAQPTYLPVVSTVSQGATGVPGDITSGAQQADTAAATDNTTLYIALGVGALALVGGVIFIVKRRSSSASVAGYRRKSRRSRR